MPRGRIRPSVTRSSRRCTSLERAPCSPFSSSTALRPPGRGWSSSSLESRYTHCSAAWQTVREPLVLNEDEVRRRLDLGALIPAMEQALAEFSTGRANQPVRTVMDISGRGFYAAMPAYMPALELIGTKLVSVFPDNARFGEPTHLATVVLNSARTGETLAIMDGRYIPEVRTAAVSAAS